MNSLFLILTSIIFPILAISWLCCIGYCVYKSLLNQFKRPGRNTKVQIVVTDRRASNVSSQDSGIIVTTHSPPQIENSTIIPNIPEVEPVNPLNISHTSQTSGRFLNTSQGSLLLSDAIKEARRQQRLPEGRSGRSLGRTTSRISGHAAAAANSSDGQKVGTKDQQMNTEPLYYPKWPQSTNVVVGDNPMAPLQAPWPLLPPIDQRGTQNRRKHSSSSLPTSVRTFLEAQNHR